MKDKHVQIKKILFPELDQYYFKYILLSTLDIEKGILNFSLLEPIYQNLRSVENYRATNFQLMLNKFI